MAAASNRTSLNCGTETSLREAAMNDAVARRMRSILRGVIDSNASPNSPLRRALTSHTTSTPSRQATTSSSPRAHRQLRAITS
jgi:hypothetical protein